MKLFMELKGFSKKGQSLDIWQGSKNSIVDALQGSKYSFG